MCLSQLAIPTLLPIIFTQTYYYPHFTPQCGEPFRNPMLCQNILPAEDQLKGFLAFTAPRVAWQIRRCLVFCHLIWSLKKRVGREGGWGATSQGDIPSHSTGTLSYASERAFCENIASGRENLCVYVCVCWTLSVSAVTASQMNLNEDIPSWATWPNHCAGGGGGRVEEGVLVGAIGVLKAEHYLHSSFQKQ